MADKTYIFEIEISGNKESAKSIADLQAATKKLKAELNKSDFGSEGYKALEEELKKVTTETKRLQAEQKKASKAFALEATVPNSYKAWQAELGLLNDQLKELSETDLKSSAGQASVKRINELQKKLKDFDANVGNFQRNVGDYENSLLRAFGKSKLGARIEAISQQFGALGSVVAGAGVAGAVVAGVMKIGEAVGAMVKEFDEAKKAVDTFGEGTVENAQKASEGVLATSKTFGVSAEQISKAAQQLAIQNGTSFEDALDRINTGLVNGQEDAGKYLDTIAEYPKKFTDAGNASKEFSDKQRAALERNKELAAAQGKLSESFARLSQTLAPAIDAVKTGATKALTFLLDYWNGLAGVISAGYEGLKSIGVSVKEFFERTVSSVTGGLYGVSAAEQDARQRRKAEQDADLAKDKEAAARLEQETMARFKRLKKGLGDAFGGLTEEQRVQFSTYSALAKLQAEQAGKQAGDAADLGFKAGLASLPADIRAQFDDNRKVLTDEQKKAQEEASKQRAEAAQKAREEAKKAAEKLAEDRAGFQKDLSTQRALEAGVLLDLTQQLVTAETNLIASEYAKQLALEKLAFADAQNVREEGYAKQAEELGKQRDKAVELYGAGSIEVLKIEQDNRAFLLQVQQTYNQINIAETQAHNNRIAEIDKQAAEAKANEKIAQLQKDLDTQRAIFEQGEQIQSERDRAELLALRALGKDKETIELEAIQQRRDAIERELRKSVEEEVRVSLSVGNGAGLTDAQKEQLEKERQARIVARERLNNDLFELDLELEEKTTETAQKAAQDRSKIIADTVTGVLGFASQGLSVFADLQKSLSDAAIKQIEEQQAQRNKSIDSLKAEKETQIGLEAEFTQQRIDNETKALEELNARKKEIEDEQKKEAKRRAVAESIINTAVGVTKIFATTVPPANFILAGIVGALGAAQTAAIIAQPLARGGIVQPYENVSGGRVTQTPNAKRSAAGDEVLAYLKTGEVVLSNENVAAIPDSVLANAGVRGFAGANSDLRPNPNLFVQSAPQPNAGQISQIVSRAVMEAAMPIMNQIATEKTRKIEVTLDPRKVARENEKQAQLDKNTRF